MAIVKRANVILNIKDDQVPFYLDKGYSVVSAGGRVLKEAVPTDINVLRKAYTDHVAKIAQLQKQLEELTKKASEDSRPLPKEEVKEETPKKSRKKKETE